MARAPATGMILYGTKAIAEFLGIRPRQALHLMEQDLMPHFRIGRSLCANRKTLTDWIHEQERVGAKGGH